MKKSFLVGLLSLCSSVLFASDFFHAGITVGLGGCDVSVPSKFSDMYSTDMGFTSYEGAKFMFDFAPQDKETFNVSGFLEIDALIRDYFFSIESSHYLYGGYGYDDSQLISLFYFSPQFVGGMKLNFTPNFALGLKAGLTADIGLFGDDGSDDSEANPFDYSDEYGPFDRFYPGFLIGVDFNIHKHNQISLAYHRAFNALQSIEGITILEPIADFTVGYSFIW